MSKTPKDRLDYFNGYRKTKRRRIDVLIDADMYGLLASRAAAHGKPLSRFIVHAAEAYLRRTYIVPDPTRIDDIELAMRRIGNNVNQIARLAWMDEGRGEAADAAYALVQSLAREIARALREPPELLSLVRERARSHPDFLIELRELVDELEAA